MPLELCIQNVSGSADVPGESQIRCWVEAALAAGDHRQVELTVRIVDAAEGADLNRRYRHKEGATNVLSFPFEDPPGLKTGILGDVVICAPVVMREAHEHGIPAAAHWAHMVVHGVLHLRGHGHDRDEDARLMEQLEARILMGLGFDRFDNHLQF